MKQQPHCGTKTTNELTTILSSDVKLSASDCIQILWPANEANSPKGTPFAIISDGLTIINAFHGIKLTLT